jgi:hypothetical protein
MALISDGKLGEANETQTNILAPHLETGCQEPGFEYPLLIMCVKNGFLPTLEFSKNRRILRSPLLIIL